MNTDDFEKQLQRQNPRQVPADWREDILRTARASAGVPDAAREGLIVRAGLKLWRELIWPCRVAWTGMTALWLVLWKINAGLPAAPRTTISAQPAPAQTMVEAIKEQRQVLAELLPPAASPTMEPSPRPSAPRSHRRVGFMTV